MSDSNFNKKLFDKIMKSEGLKNFFDQYNVAITVLLALASLLVIALFFINVAKLSRSGDNERKRQDSKDGILACIICAAVLGSIDVVYAILSAFVFG